jgi:hypothetical protein
MLRSFLVSWIIYWCLVAMLPVHSIYPSVFGAILLQVGFVVLVTVGYLTLTSVFGTVRMPDVNGVWLMSAKSIVSWAMLLSLIGFVFLFYDKVFVQEIDFSDGLALAREQWREIGVARDGRASSIWSALGYLVGSCYYVAIFVLFVQPKSFGGLERQIYIAMSFILALANSLITGGRSNFLLLFAFAIAAFGARRGASLKALLPSKRQRRTLKILSAATLFYIVYVFFSRAKATGVQISSYVEGFLPYMGLRFDGWYENISQNEWVAEIGHTTILVVGYLTHSLATVAAILDQPSEDKTILFSNFASLLYKVGLISNPETEWFLAGRFPSFPGLLWHQYGPVGFLVASLVIGAVARICCLWASSSSGRRGILPLGLYALVSTTLLLTPYVSAPDVLSFPFVLSAFIIMALLNQMIFRVRRIRIRRPCEIPTPQS